MDEITLAVNTLDSITEFYKLVHRDITRDGTVIKGIILESLCGPAVREAEQLSLLAGVLGARKHTVLDIKNQRVQLEERQEMIPLLEKLARKPPEGDKIMTWDWKLKAGQFYESKSEIIKGHHCIYKVCFLLYSCSPF